MRIDIYSDTICPWCFIGKRRLERALRERPQDNLSIHWRPFQLNPDMPAEGMDRELYLRQKFGGETNAQQVYRAIEQAGEEEGIAFDFGAIPRTPNTVQSHRLIRFAEGRQAQDAVVEGLFQAYFLDARDIGERAVLLEVAEAAGLDPAETGGFLDSDDGAAEIRAEDLRARMAGVTGVPCFIFNGNYALPGAQKPEVMFQLFDLAREEASASEA
jgi:predicted DsbA family dithiol-disulfide isomerase